MRICRLFIHTDIPRDLISPPPHDPSERDDYFGDRRGTNAVSGRSQRVRGPRGLTVYPPRRGRCGPGSLGPMGRSRRLLCQRYRRIGSPVAFPLTFIQMKMPGVHSTALATALRSFTTRPSSANGFYANRRSLSGCRVRKIYQRCVEL